jgi:hypothetical protein
MSASRALAQLLLSHAPVTAIVGTRVFPERRPQGTDLPCVTYTRIGGSSIQSLDTRDTLAWAQYQVEAWAKDYATAEALAKEIRDRLGLFRGTIDSVKVQGIRIELAQQDTFDPPPSADDVGVYHISQDYTLFYEG